MTDRNATKAAADLEKPSKEVQSTNLGAAYALSFSDIPNMKQIASMLQPAVEKFDPRIIHDNARIKIMAAYAEARYKAIDELLRRSGVSQVVEFAAGLTPRGINNPKWNYVHTDQDESSLKLIREISEKVRT